MDVRTLSLIPDWDWPPDAGEVLLAALQGKGVDEDERLLAAELAGSIVVIDDALARALLALVENPDEDEELRGTAAIALGPILEDLDLEIYADEPEGPPVTPETERAIRRGLRNVYMDGAAPKLVRRRVLEGSIRAPEPWHPGAVRAAFYEDDPEWRVTAVFCMSFVPGFEDEILEALLSEERRVRYEAVRAAGMREIEEAWPVVRRLLRTPPDRDFLLAAIEAAPLVDPEAAVDELFWLTEERVVDDDDVLRAAEDALEMANLYLGHYDLQLEEMLEELDEDPEASPSGEAGSGPFPPEPPPRPRGPQGNGGPSAG